MTSEEIAPHDHDAAAPHAVEPEPYAEDAADIAELAIGADAKAPSLEEVQEVTAAAASSESVTQVAYVGADWIRSDDDIIPMKGKTLRAMKKSRKDEPLLQPIAVGEDPIALFSPMEEPAEKKSKRGRLSRKKRAEELDAEIAQLNLDAQAGLGVEELIAGSVTTDEAAEPVLEPVDDDHTDHVDVSVTDADAAVTADAAITSDTSSDDTEDGDETTDVLVPPRIEDAGLPELPDLPGEVTFFDHGDTDTTSAEDSPVDDDPSAEATDEEPDTSTDEPEKKRRLRLRRK